MGYYFTLPPSRKPYPSDVGDEEWHLVAFACLLLHRLMIDSAGTMHKGEEALLGARRRRCDPDCYL